MDELRWVGRCWNAATPWSRTSRSRGLPFRRRLRALLQVADRLVDGLVPLANRFAFDVARLEERGREPLRESRTPHHGAVGTHPRERFFALRRDLVALQASREHRADLGALVAAHLGKDLLDETELT